MKVEFICYDCDKNDPIGRIQFIPQENNKIEVKVISGDIPIFVECIMSGHMEKVISTTVKKICQYTGALIFLERVVYVSEILGEIPTS